jgi:hypothetical protein
MENGKDTRMQGASTFFPSPPRTSPVPAKARLRRMASDTTVTARFWPTTRAARRSLSSSRRAESPRERRSTGMPVQRATTCSRHGPRRQGGGCSGDSGGVRSARSVRGTAHMLRYAMPTRPTRPSGQCDLSFTLHEHQYSVAGTSPSVEATCAICSGPTLSVNRSSAARSMFRRCSLASSAT